MVTEDSSQLLWRFIFEFRFIFVNYPNILEVVTKNTAVVSLYVTSYRNMQQLTSNNQLQSVTIVIINRFQLV